MKALAHSTGERFGIAPCLLSDLLGVKRELVCGVSARRLSKVLVFQERLDESLHVGIINNGDRNEGHPWLSHWPMGWLGRVEGVSVYPCGQDSE